MYHLFRPDYIEAVGYRGGNKRERRGEQSASNEGRAERGAPTGGAWPRPVGASGPSGLSYPESADAHRRLRRFLVRERDVIAVLEAQLTR